VQRFFNSLKVAFKDAAGLCFFSIFRQAERLLSGQRFYSMLRPFFAARAGLNSLFKPPQPSADLPDFLRASRTVAIARQQRRDGYLNHVIEFFPDRLGGAKWMNHCRITGLSHVQQARQDRRAVLLAFCHFGPYYLLRFWLRAAGFPAATFIGGKSEIRPRLARFKDRFSPFPEIPVAFYQDQLRAVSGFLAAGNPLLIPIDAPVGKQMIVPFCDGWSFQMATGAVRLAIRHRAALIPCSIIDEGGWHFCLKFGWPVPEAYLATEADWPRAGKHLLAEMMGEFQAHPQQCSVDLTRCLKPNPPPSRIPTLPA